MPTDVELRSGDPHIFQHGTCVLITHSIPANALEGWVKKVATESGQNVDWCFISGRAHVVALGDIEKVRAAMEKLRPEYDAIFHEAVDSIIVGHGVKPPWWRG